jgi:hypothetical protein
LALPTGSWISPFVCSRSIASQSKDLALMALFVGIGYRAAL